MSETVKPTAVEAASVPSSRASRGYPKPFAARVAGRERRALGDAFGLTNFGVNLTRLPPGGMSALRHTHLREDEFIYIVEGEPVLVTNAAATYSISRSATAIPGTPSSTRTRTSAERSPRMANAFSCIGTADPTDAST